MLLDIGQDALSEIGSVEIPDTVVGEPRLFALAKRSIRQLVSRSDVVWDELIDTHSFTTTSGEDTYTLPSDFHAIINGTAWDEAEDRELIGPLDADEWQDLRRRDPASTIERHYRIAKDRDSLTRSFLLFPEPTTTGDTITYEYLSAFPVKSSGGTAQKTWQDDTDEAIIDEDLITLDLKWRFLRSAGLAYAEEFRDFEAALNDRKMRAGQKTYHLGRQAVVRRFRTQEGDFTL